MPRTSNKAELIMDYVNQFIQENGFSPSVREIGAAVGLKSPSTVHFYMKGLEEAGMVVKAEGKTRAISITDGSHNRKDQVPLVGSVAAGSPILAQECIEDYLTFDTQGLEGEHFALTVRGESMLGAGILPGDLVVVHQQRDARNGEIVVALFEDEATVKTLSRRDGHTWLLPENDAYEPIDGDNAEIIGKVVGVVRRY